ncbi:peptide deformylase [Candidatus Formimonas warabiya]|uniref:Peptide deformylase n=1 Tax=Formimonas warabiya TaxID=1761012 RepID=A0A3G1KQH7_FORW1|nr:peptide deformylase [Candidatus Formimonas warabiya]ATW24698.1 peptide deformylase [Candidatus Formimonas warabiya]
MTAVYQIVKIGDPVLREQAKKVPKVTPNVVKLVENMADTMRAANGVGLAAPQIGISKSVVVIDVGEGLIELINPEIIAQEGEEVFCDEGCLSIPGVQGDVSRAAKVTVTAWDRTGKTFQITGTGMLAQALQHEIDHLYGILFVDKTLK